MLVSDSFSLQLIQNESKRGISDYFMMEERFFFSVDTILINDIILNF